MLGPFKTAPFPYWLFTTIIYATSNPYNQIITNTRAMQTTSPVQSALTTNLHNKCFKH